MKLFFHKIKNWEYWPVWVVYFPAFLFSLILFLRIRKVDFYKLINPCLTNGGLFCDSKLEMYKLFPGEFLPETLYVSPGSWDEEELSEWLREKNISFPCIVKPDIGMRGKGVRLIGSLTQLVDFLRGIDEPYLIQERIAYSEEIGVFYYRLPGSNLGAISGITYKVFLSVEGDGVSSIEELLKKSKRFEMQIQALKNEFQLDYIPRNRERLLLVPFGNHNRGTMFLNGGSDLSLTEVFRKLCDPISGFYYGRLDIRYETIDLLREGKNYKIIEWNGAKSEPTHIYDPKTSFWQGQREIFRHILIIYKILLRSKSWE